jgi:hypothetical protein
MSKPWQPLNVLIAAEQASLLITGERSFPKSSCGKGPAKKYARYKDLLGTKFEEAPFTTLKAH